MRKKLDKIQFKAFREACERPFYALFMEAGTGKTAVAIELIDHAFKYENLHRVVIFVPDTIQYNWEQEIKSWSRIKNKCIHRMKGSGKKVIKNTLDLIDNVYTLKTKKELQSIGLRGRTKAQMLENESPKLQIIILNYEKVRSKQYLDLVKKFKPDFLIVDESHNLRNSQAAITKNIYRVTRKCRRRLILTGTPICRGYEDIFSQFKIIDSNILGTNYKNFEAHYIKKGGYMGHQIVGYKNVDNLLKTIKDNSFTVTLAETIDLPPISEIFISCELEPKVRKIYDTLQEEMVVGLNEDYNRKDLKSLLKEHSVDYNKRASYSELAYLAYDMELLDTTSCDLVITQIIRLHQIAGGFITTDSGKINQVSSAKINLLMNYIDNQYTKEPLLIFCQYVPEIELIEASLKKKYPNKIVRNFRDRKKRDEIYQDFQRGAVDFLLLQLSSGSVGLNLQLANHMIIYSCNTKYNDWAQSLARVRRRGQKKSTKVTYLIVENTRDEIILQGLKLRQKMGLSIF